MYPAKSILVAAGQLSIATLVMLSYPMTIPTCRICLDKVFSLNTWGSNAVPPSGNNSVAGGPGTGEMSTFKHVALTVGIVSSAFTTAYFVEDLEMGESPREVMRLTGT